MLNKVFMAGAVTAGLVAFAPMALAQAASNSPGSRADKDGQFYATPVQKGAPRDLPGEQLVPGAPLIVNVIDGVTRPLLVDPIQGAGAALGDPLAPLAGPAPAAAPAAKAKRHARIHRRHHTRVAAHHRKAKAG